MSVYFCWSSCAALVRALPEDHVGRRAEALDALEAKRGRCVGAAKANAGHSEAASGQVGLFKVVHQLCDGGNAQLRVLNPHVRGATRGKPSANGPETDMTRSLNARSKRARHTHTPWAKRHPLPPQNRREESRVPRAEPSLIR